MRRNCVGGISSDVLSEEIEYKREVFSRISSHARSRTKVRKEKHHHTKLERFTIHPLKHISLDKRHSTIVIRS